MRRKVYSSIVFALAALSLITASSAAHSAAQSTTTPTIPVKTQVWLDITATAAAQPTKIPTATATASATASATVPATVTPPATLTPIPSFTPDYTATYEAEFAAALLTVTAQNAPGATETLADSPGLFPSETGLVRGGTYSMGTTVEEAIAALDECALYGRTCTDTNWVSDAYPPHQVTVDDFYMERTEVTLAQYVAFLNWLGPYSHVSGCDGFSCATTLNENEVSLIAFDGERYSLLNASYYQNHPAAMVTWYGANTYCRAIGRRLPTEAEWERAARGPNNLIYPWGNEFNTLFANTAISATGGTLPAGTGLGLSDFGISDLAGNVNEWTADWYQPDWYTRQTSIGTDNPTGPFSGTEKVLRGGGWDTIPLFTRSVHRMSASPDTTSAGIGFRCVEGGGIETEPLPTQIATLPPTPTP